MWNANVVCFFSWDCVKHLTALPRRRNPEEASQQFAHYIGQYLQLKYAVGITKKKKKERKKENKTKEKKKKNNRGRLESFPNDYVLMQNNAEHPQVRNGQDDAKPKSPKGRLGLIVQSYHHDTFCLTLSVGRTL